MRAGICVNARPFQAPAATMNFNRIALLISSFLVTGAANALCPWNTSYDAAANACVDANNAFGPFTRAMTAACTAQGQGAVCTNTVNVYFNGTNVTGTAVPVARWSKSFQRGVRGTGVCPAGSAQNASFDNLCVETTAQFGTEVYNNYPQSWVDVCRSPSINGGNACYMNRWAQAVYTSVRSRVNGAVTSNKFGAWLFLISETGGSHAQLAQKLSALGIKRIFIKIADDTQNCTLFPDACVSANVNEYKSRGIEPWAWSYNRPSANARSSATALYRAAQAGYVGYVTDVEAEYDGVRAALETQMIEFKTAIADARRDGYIGANQVFPLAATTWANPRTHNFAVDILDRYVDMHMPQNYLDIAGASYLADPKRWIDDTNCEYRSMGANKPIWQILSNEPGNSAVSIRATAVDINNQLFYAGPNASVWAVPGNPAIPLSEYSRVWNLVSWKTASFSTATQCATGNNVMRNY
jgi:hypothetical protein